MKNSKIKVRQNSNGTKLRGTAVDSQLGCALESLKKSFFRQNFITFQTNICYSHIDYAITFIISRPHIKKEAVELDLSSFQCALCGFSTSSESALVTHVSSAHSDESINEVVTDYTCVLCGKSNPGPIELSAHLKKSHGKETICCYCQEQRSSASCTMRHIDTVHLDIRKYPCKFCNHRFTCNRDLKNHISSSH